MYNPSASDISGRPVGQYSNGNSAMVGQELKDEWTLSIPDNVLFQQIGDDGSEMVLLDVQNGGYFGVNLVGASIWRLAQEGHTVGAILAALLQEYDVSEEQLKNDLAQFLNDLRSRGLIEITENDAG